MASIIIAALSLTVSAIVGFFGLKRALSSDTKSSATEMTTVIIKLETISSSVAEIKSDVRSMRSDVQDLRDRLIVVEQSVKSAHHRIDTIEGKE